MKMMPNLMRRLKEDRGITLIITALAMSILLGFMGLAIDVGLLYRAQRKLQIAADSAAIAGTLEYLYTGSLSSATTYADNASSANGFTNGSGGVVVAAYDPPADGPNTGSTSFFESIVSQPTPTIFMSLFGIKTVTIKARAVAGVPTNGLVCMWVMGTGSAALDLQGAYNVDSPSCGIYVNSPSTTGFIDTGNGGIVNASFLDVVGDSPPAHQTTPTPTTVNTAPRTDPWGDFAGATPTNGLCTTTDSSTTSLTGTLTGPGLNNAICYTKPVTLTNATLGPGTYMFENGVTISGTDTVNSGTIDIYGGTFNQGNAILNITAPTSGSFNGIALLQTPTDTNQLQVQFGSSNQTFTGYIYAPGAPLYLQDNGGGVTSTGFVAGTFFDKASTFRIPSYDIAHSSTTPNRVVTLVE
jgi:hypothetical protein